MADFPKYVKPENWVDPPDPDPVVLTAGQRDAAKTLLETWINNQGEPVPIGEVVRVAQSYVRNNYGKHIDVQTVVDIVVEIQTDWGHWPPPVEP